MQALIILSSLLESWDTLVVTAINSAPEGKLTMDIIINSLLNEEARRKEQGMVVQSEYNIVENRGRSENCETSASRSHDKSRG